MNNDHYQQLVRAVDGAEHFDYPFQSRIHQLRSFPEKCFVKRDDELGFGISGSKIRKFRTLLPDLVKQKIDTVIVIGSAYSNNVLGVVQLLLENGIAPILFLLGDAKEDLQGTHLLIRILVEKESVKWISHENWPQVFTKAQEHADELVSTGKRVAILPEGSVLPSAIPGAASLALDVIRNEETEKVSFDRIFLDAGTGFQAAVTMLAFAFLEKRMKFSIVLMADTQEVFEKKLIDYHLAFEEWLRQKVPFPKDYELLLPTTAKSFGSVNAQVMESLLHIARSEGILIDPIYSAKLFGTAKDMLRSVVEGSTLIVHSGGGLSVSGFQSQLAKKIKDHDEQK